MPDAPAEADLGMAPREVHRLWRGGCLAADRAPPEINGLAVSPDTLLLIVYQNVGRINASPSFRVAEPH